MTALTERQQREKEYYNQFAASFNPEKDEVDLAPVLGPLSGEEFRPWNSYWAVYQMAHENFKEGAKMLDFGSGPGENALRFAKLGYDVSGFDISDANVEISKKLFSKRGEKGDFIVSSAESLPYEDESFDVIIGIDILHHVDIPQSLNEIHRILKTGGKAIFREPVEVPFLDWIRNTRPVLAFAPKEVSFERHITEDERKLNFKDEEVLSRVFPKMKKRHFSLFSRFDKFYREGSDPSASFLERLDYWLIKNVPVLGLLGGTVIYELEK